MKRTKKEVQIFKAVEMELSAHKEVGNILDKMKIALERENMIPIRLEMVNGEARARFRLAQPIYLKDDYTDEGDDSKIYSILTNHLYDMGIDFDFQWFCYEIFGENGEIPPWMIF
jgi:hypothetical protein